MQKSDIRIGKGTLLLLLLMVCFNAFGQKQYSFLQVDNTKGLVTNQVNCIYKDTRGFIWIGTASGLSRYDGVSFVNYRHSFAEANSIPDNYVNDIQEDSRKNLWIETISGLVVFDVKKERLIEDVEEYLGIESGGIAIERVFIDDRANIWVKLVGVQYYHKYDEINRSLINVCEEKKENTEVASFQSLNDKSYYLFANGTIECYNQESNELLLSLDFLSDKMTIDSLSTELFIDEEEDIWFYGNNEGVYHYKSKLQKWEHYSTNTKPIKLSSNIIKKIIQDEKGLIWVGTDHGGIDIINKYTSELINVSHNPYDEKSLAQNSITDIYLDNNGIIWIGTFKKGLSYYHESIHKFPHYKHWMAETNSLPYSDVNCFVEDKKGNLWIGTNGGGLIYYDRKNDKYTSYYKKNNDVNSLSNNVVVSLFIDSEEQLWIGTFTGGLNRFDGKKFHHYQFGSSVTSNSSSNSVWTIVEDQEQNLYIGTLGGGIVLYNKKTKEFSELPNKGNVSLPSLYINQIYKMPDGNMAIATHMGLVFYHVKEQRYKYHPNKNKANPLLEGNDFAVNAIYEDSRGLYWLATRNGLVVFNPDTEYAKFFTEDDGLPEDIINCIQEDNSQTIWVSKSTGLSQIVVDEKSFRSGEYVFRVYDFTQEDGLQDKEFNPLASYKTTNGELIFGGINGFNIFNPADIKHNNILPRVVFTDFKVYNKRIQPEEKVRGKVLLNNTISFTEQIELSNTMNVFTIDFSALDFFIPNKVKYKYKLEGFDAEWIQATDKQYSVTYTNLNAGDYYFKVKASNNDGVWNENSTQLHIKVLPPFYATKLAYLIYLSLFLLALVLFRYAMLKKERLKFEAKQEQLQKKRNEEMDEMKLRFLTNVSHEFRTPLTLILTPLDRLLSTVTGVEEKKLLGIIDENSRQLLDLVNHLLDFRKLELHGMKYNPSYGDVVFFLKEVAQKFQEAFKKKNINFKFEHTEEQFMFMYDKEKMQNVMMNLLSNALKFTPEGGKVELFLNVNEDKTQVEIKVVDNGVGISADDIDKIFIRFFQSDKNVKLGISGSGIGLNLVQEMVQLHNGSVSVSSEEEHGACFTVVLPVEKKEAEATELIEDESCADNEVSLSKNSSILLVEDNIDFRRFMKDTLQSKFKVLEASDGEQGYKLAHEHLPDLIISDVMMPNVDGLELCKKLRNDIRTSHIPFILLTARTADEDKIKGLEIGADDYIAKPFNMHLLLLRVGNLIAKRHEMQNKFQKSVDISPSELEITSLDEKLIKKAINIVEDNIADASFTVENLSKQLGMSRVYLYKKLLSITGKSPTEFIRIIRLKRGAQLLEKSQMNISEVAYEVGFNSPRYFSKYFKEEYGMLPTEYVKSKGEEQ